MKDFYFTAEKRNTFVYEEKKSVFTATLAPVSDEREALEFVNEIKRKYPDARHNVFAYKTNVSGVISERFSDDGEPKGTAGKPVSDAISASGLENICVVVTRYFGGILLGASGLTRAYANTAGGVLNSCVKIKMEMCRKTALTMDYALYGKVQKYIENSGISCEKPEFSDVVKVNCIVPLAKENSFISDIEELTSALCKVDLVAKGFYKTE